ncbi:MAG: hypothetical protein J0L56_19895 [Chitinophagales bacterium]|nr:hypothetical protein [Chitinophagales bacterium]
MNRCRLLIFLFLTLFSASTSLAQTPLFSLATDMNLQRNFKKGQQYWAVGQTVQGQLNFTPKDGLYVWASYFSDGQFSNQLIASAKQPATVPQQISYRNNAQMRFKHLSTGWKKYLAGSCNAEEGFNIYTYAGFGLALGRVINTPSVSIDSTDYLLPVSNGKANFKRLTLDLGLGWEIPLGGDIYLYAEGRTWIPASSYPSKYLFVNKNAPMIGMFNAGVRILFD